MRKTSIPPGGLGRTSIRLSLQFSFLYSLLSAAIFLGAYWLTDFEVRDWILERMQSDATVLSRIYEEDGANALIARIETLSEINFEASRIFQLTDQHGTLLAGNILSIATDQTDGFVRLADVSLVSNPQELEVSGYWISLSQIGPYQLLQGSGDHLIAEVLEVLAAVLLVGFMIVIGLGLLVGVWVGRITESRIAAISEALDRVSEGDLTSRVPDVEGANDDLAWVSSRINATLNQLQALLESQQQISTDIAHDMRTPLQRLRQRLERMEARNPPDPEDAHAALRETEDIISTFNALLRIAQIGAGDRRERFEDVDLNEIVETVFEAFEPAAEEANQTLTVRSAHRPVTVSGDRDLLMQMAANLLENALRHCPPGSRIEIGTDAGPQEVSFWVSDDGPGIAASDADRMFRRFYRGEQSRTSPGHGLGLAMVKAIADLHEASVTMSDNEPGLRITSTFASSGLDHATVGPTGVARKS